jgi:hypothetical protein
LGTDGLILPVNFAAWVASSEIAVPPGRLSRTQIYSELAEPPIMRYYVWNSAKKAFDVYTINKGHVGGGLQIRVADLDADGDIDIVVAGK